MINKNLFDCRNKSGFTLIELLVVIVIVGILAVVFLPRLIGSTSSARDAKRMAAIQRIHEALQNDLDGSLSLPVNGCINTSVSGWTQYLPALGGELPQDPIDGYTWSTYPIELSGFPIANWLIRRGSSNTQFDATMCGLNGEYVFVNGPSDGGGSSYSYGLYAILENTDNANTNCTRFEVDGSDLSNAPVESNSCYVVLTQ